MTRFVLDVGVRRMANGRVLAGGTPFRLFRLTTAGSSLIDRIVAGEPVPAASRRLTDRLVGAGVLHPVVKPMIEPDPKVARVEADPSANRVHVVMPVYGSLGALPHADGASILVVDDASPVPIQCDSPHVTVVRLAFNGGPGAARAHGAASVTTDLIAFVDSDVRATPGWLNGLVGHFDDPLVALVAPRVSSAAGDSLLARYEAWRSPLDLGGSPALIVPGGRVSYVPAAAFVVRRTAYEAIGGFDTSLRFGEDVDLVWRLVRAGWRCRFEPDVVVHHEPRTSWRAWVAQRRGYGSSAASLAMRHPGELAPVRMSAWSAAAWAAVLLGSPAAGVAITATSTLELTRRFDDFDRPLAEARRLAGLGTLFAGRQLASAVTRAWWPIALLAALLSRRARGWIVASAIIPPILDWRQQRPPFDPVRATALRIADDLSYGIGLWRGVLNSLTVAPLVPRLAWRDRWTRRPQPETRNQGSEQAAAEHDAVGDRLGQT